VQVVQGAAVLVALLNIISLWKQEPRQARRGAREATAFRAAGRVSWRSPKIRRFLWTVGLGTVAFSMQDIVLEPFGGRCWAWT
jgi:MFS transporter, BCD family, chlorophyll transporter